MRWSLILTEKIMLKMREGSVYVVDINSVVEWPLQAEGAVVETIAAVLSRTKPFDPAFCWTIIRPGWKLV